MKYQLIAEGEVQFEAETAVECMEYGNAYHKDGYTVSVIK